MHIKELGGGAYNADSVFCNIDGLEAGLDRWRGMFGWLGLDLNVEAFACVM